MMLSLRVRSDEAHAGFGVLSLSLDYKEFLGRSCIRERRKRLNDMLIRQPTQAPQQCDRRFCLPTVTKPQGMRITVQKLEVVDLFSEEWGVGSSAHQGRPGRQVAPESNGKKRPWIRYCKGLNALGTLLYVLQVSERRKRRRGVA